jgi:uncharacterized membrane protein YdfJ with MMPL/SSD domain
LRSPANPEPWVRTARAVVDDRSRQRDSGSLDRDAGAAGPTVLGSVGKGFRDHEVDRGLHGVRGSLDIARHRHRDRHRCSLCQILDRCTQATVRKQRRAQTARKVAQLAEGAERGVPRPAHGLPSRVRITGELLLGHPQVHRQRHQARLSAVVQVSLDPFELLVGRHDHVGARGGELAHASVEALALGGTEDPGGDGGVSRRQPVVEQQNQRGRADQIINAKFPQTASEQVLIQSGKLTTKDPTFGSAVRDVVGRLSGIGTVQNVRSPLSPPNSGEVSSDGHSALVGFEIRGDSSAADKRVAESLAATAAAQRSLTRLTIQQAGDASADKALNKSFSDDFAKARTLSLPITLIILIVAFGALVAAGIPVILAITGVGATLGLVALVSQIAPVDPTVSEVVLLVGMAVGVDYSLFYMRREREERAAGRGEQAALQAAAATSGRSVLVSGLTVMAAMAGMYLAGDKTFSSMATGTILVVAVSVIGSLTVLPALLSRLGDGVMKGGVPFVARRRERGGEGRIWGAVVDRVLGHPWTAALLSGGVVFALAIPAFGTHTSAPGLQGLPSGLPIVKTINRIEDSFPGGAVPAHVVVQAHDVTSPQVRSEIRAMERRALATGQMHQPFSIQISNDHSTADVGIPLVGKGTDAASDHALDALRTEVIPVTVGKLPGVTAQVTGTTAGAKDFNDSMKSHLPLVFGFVLTITFPLLLLTFRSIVIPLTAIGLNLLSVGAAYGVLALVFQHSWAEGVLGFKSTAAGGDEAARRGQLVPAQAVALAASTRARARARMSA